MSTVTAKYHSHPQAIRNTSMTAEVRVRTLLRFTFGLVPLIAGADKFTNILVNWDQYLSPGIANAIPMSSTAFMLIVGVIEIIAGLIVLMRPRLGSIIVCFWLIAIAINLLLMGNYYDVAVRDIVMAIGAYSLFILAGSKDE